MKDTVIMLSFVLKEVQVQLCAASVKNFADLEDNEER